MFTGSSRGFVSASQMAQMGLSSATPQEKQAGGGQILLLLLRLRQCCSHLSLMKDVRSARYCEVGFEMKILLLFNNQ